MTELIRREKAPRYQVVTEKKAGGATYTPQLLADFVAKEMVEGAGGLKPNTRLRVLDPAVGQGELLVSLLDRLSKVGMLDIEVFGFETDPESLQIATTRLKSRFRQLAVRFELRSFLEFLEESFEEEHNYSLFRTGQPERYDLIIANPPYVRTQIMGAAQARRLAKQFDLAGRVDLAFPFILGIARALKPDGIAGIIVSNRFMTTKSGASVRSAILDRFNILHVWDLGDTKLFGAAVLPAVLLLGGKERPYSESPDFTSIYQSQEASRNLAPDPIVALSSQGIVEINDGRRFQVRHGKLDTNGAHDGLWRIAAEDVDTWFVTVENHTWGTFRDIGMIRVGVKTCADRVFIRSDWEDLPEEEQPELLRPVASHHVARRFKALKSENPQLILYPHEVFQGKRQAVELFRYPRARAYLERHREILEARTYVLEAGRQWYEIWVPQDPDAWAYPKLVFRDIAEKPVFWVDMDGSVVNGDCYWLACSNHGKPDLLWLAAAVGNSSFIEKFYDLRFHNKLYAGRRRFITQYVEQFPLPNPTEANSRAIISMAKEIYDAVPSDRTLSLENDINELVWEAYGLVAEEMRR